MHFVKMEGLGNDYLYLNCLSGVPEDLPALAVRLSDRHFGPGADGIICICPGTTGDFTMVMYNADGSRGAMCGNGIRCFGRYVWEKGLTDRTCLTIDTDAGPRKLELWILNHHVEQVTVDMGEPRLSPARILRAEEGSFSALPVSMGNPHAVIFCPDPADIPLERLGPRLERHPDLPERSNIEFAAVPDRENAKVRVWERGSGITLACGTGACAVFAAARSLGLCGNHLRLHLPGGALETEARSGRIFLTGPAHWVYEGDLTEH